MQGNQGHITLMRAAGFPVQAHSAGDRPGGETGQPQLVLNLTVEGLLKHRHQTIYCNIDRPTNHSLLLTTLNNLLFFTLRI